MEQATTAWVAAGVAAGLAVPAWMLVRRLPVGRLRDYLSDLAWTPAVCLGLWAWIDGDLRLGLFFTLLMAPIAAANNVLWDMAFDSPPNDPSAVDPETKAERDALRARVLSPQPDASLAPAERAQIKRQRRPP